MKFYWVCSICLWLPSLVEVYSITLLLVVILHCILKSLSLVLFFFQFFFLLFANFKKSDFIYMPISILLVFFYTEIFNYHIHRFMHKRIMYKLVHKWHHRYVACTSFSATAMHPCEFLIYQGMLFLITFIIPIHAIPFTILLIYFFYYGMLDHSGIIFNSVFPWQPSSKFHDDHHKYFHCNFGQNTVWMDTLHNTVRKTNRVYDETIFGGRGAAADQTAVSRSVPINYRYC